ncbi:alpha-glucan family phosphorylase [candidate division KSB1 bacterium]|nr:alpha-glucan family phosphorylase [candidate division KSB1 bacterium]
MKTIKTYKVVPNLPKEVKDLQRLAGNLYWSWDHDVRQLYRRLDRKLWETVKQNPVELLNNLEQSRLETRAKDEGYLAHLSRVRQTLDNYLDQKTWFQKNYGDQGEFHIAYFSMEYGLAASLPIYAGGLGVLAGDHLKSASDLGLPLVGIGLLYQQGYFHQYLSTDGWQQEMYPEVNFHNLPVELVRVEDNDEPLMIALNFPGRTVYAQIWKTRVGRVPLYLLDSNVPQNQPEDQKITDQLYGGDSDKRIRQEILLGIGGIRALDALNIRPQVCHMNEGHSAFMALERARLLMLEKGLSFPEAQEATRGGNVFTSHTPVAAGIDEFEPQMIDHYLGAYYDSLKISQQEFHALGGVNREQTQGKFNMAIFAMRMAGYCNGVSKLHGKVARQMWHYLWPDALENELPIGYVTNGVHIRTWIAEDIADLFDLYLGPRWHENPADTTIWSRIANLPDEELWRAHERRREHLVAFVRNRLKEQLIKSSAGQADIEAATNVLNPKALTIGFARRFAQYKRASLLFRDLERLTRLLNNADRPVQILYAGKAHPRDNIGKGIIRDIITTIRHSDLRNKIVFLEDYDMRVASYLVSGVDVWLNTPRRPREASGTSGMKAAANGVLNLSIPDGWWDEAYQNQIGWSIGRGEIYPDLEEQDQIESEALYYLLEKEVIPLFYNRKGNGVPTDWIDMMKNCIQKINPIFNTHRMVEEYFVHYYLPAAQRWNRLIADDIAATRTLLEWKAKVSNNWHKVKFVQVQTDQNTEYKVGAEFKVAATVDVDGLTPEDLCVQVYYGPIGSDGEIENGSLVQMNLQKKLSANRHLFTASITCSTTGQHGYAFRILPANPESTHPLEMGLIHWYEENI